MTQFLTTKQALSAIEEIIDHARERLVLLSPYQRIAPTFRARLAAAAKRGVDITVVYGKQEMDADQLAELRQLPRTRLVFSERLHAKCYFNESVMVITSLNLLTSSEQNWEMGVRLHVTDDAYRAAVREAELIIASEQAVQPDRVGRMREPRVTYRARTRTGFCIRCRASISFEPDRPLCNGCYASWAEWQNWDYPERWCHECGEAHDTSRAKPLCYPCFSRSVTAF